MFYVNNGSSYPAQLRVNVRCVLSFQSAIFTNGVHYLNETNRLLSGTVILGDHYYSDLV